MKRLLYIFLLLILSTSAKASVVDADSKLYIKEDKEKLFQDSVYSSVKKDTVTYTHHRDFFHRIGDVFTGFFREFNRFDVSYIEPQKYNYAAMLQSTTTYEVYKLSDKDGKSFTFAPEMSYKLGPYFGWRWLFLGYTIDLSHISASSKSTNREEFDISLYSSMLGIDLYWRETGNNYKIRSVDLGKNIDTSPLEGSDYNGLQSTIKGFNLYYIFNHHKFSYPAAYSQSNVQRKSAGSFLAGLGYAQQTLSVDWKNIEDMIDEKLNIKSASVIDSSLLFGTIHYTDISISGGYAYNWVFAKNWLFDISLQLALAYKQSKSDLTHEHFRLQDFNFKNFNLDGIGRFGLVYNNSKWFAGMSSILHANNYHKKQFSTNNIFGNLYIYIGFNFGRRK